MCVLLVIDLLLVLLLSVFHVPPIVARCDLSTFTGAIRFERSESGGNYVMRACAILKPNRKEADIVWVFCVRG